MVKAAARIILVVCVSVSFSCVAVAEVVAYTDETAFLNAVALQGYLADHEGFENDGVWGATRSPQSVPSVTHLGITWTSSSVNNNIASSSGAAMTGQWGLYSLPHGDYANGITDGVRGTATQVMVAVGGWVRTNTPPAGLALFLDGDAQNSVDFGGANTLGSGELKFFGVIDTNGFTVFDFRETEGTIGDQKFVFFDNFYFAFGGVIQDCNQNGIADGLDIANETSSDCNQNFIPDECELDANSPAPGGPYYCTANCAADCNHNGLLDACEVVMPEIHTSGQLSPIGAGVPQSFELISPLTYGDVILEFTAYANLGGGSDQIAVDINGVNVGSVFGPDGSDCPEQQPDAAQLVVPEETFNTAVNGGDAVIHLVASPEVDPQGCNQPTYITVDVWLFVPSAVDANGNGVPDECEPCQGDFDGDSDIDSLDAAAFLECMTGPYVETVELGCDCGDIDADQDVDLVDWAWLQLAFTGS